MTRASGLAVLEELGANQCPVCRADHQHLDKLWACPPPPIGHGHKLGAPIADGDWEHRKCPAPGCKYTRSAPRKPRNPAKGDPMTALNTRPCVPVNEMYDQAERLRQLLPAGLDSSSFMGSAASALYNNADLMAAAENDPASFMIALTECAALGHIPGSKEYYLTPRGKGGKRNATVLGIEGYRGIVQRMYNSGHVAKVTWREVCANDLFDFIEGQHDVPVHSFGGTNRAILKPTGADFFGASGSIDRGEMVGVYAYAKLINGGTTRVALLTREDVHARRAAGGWTATDRYSPWNREDGGPDHPEFKGRSMWWKSALKAAEPAVPTSSEDKRVPAVHAEQVQERPSVTLTAAPAPAPAVAQETRQALPAPRQKPARRREQPAPASAKDGVVIKALWAAIHREFGRIGVEDNVDERENWVRKLNQDAEGDLTADQLRIALGMLGEKDRDGYAIPDYASLVELCDPGEVAEPIGDPIEVPF